jgi:hypothetical protein
MLQSCSTERCIPIQAIALPIDTLFTGTSRKMTKIRVAMWSLLPKQIDLREQGEAEDDVRMRIYKNWNLTRRRFRNS